MCCWAVVTQKKCIFVSRGWFCCSLDAALLSWNLLPVLTVSCRWAGWWAFLPGFWDSSPGEWSVQPLRAAGTFPSAWSGPGCLAEHGPMSRAVCSYQQSSVLVKLLWNHVYNNGTSAGEAGAFLCHPCAFSGPQEELSVGLRFPSQPSPCSASAPRCLQPSRATPPALSRGAAAWAALLFTP